MTVPGRSRITERTRFLFVSLITVAVYSNALTVPFHYDDFHFLKENITIKSPGAFLSWLLSDPGSLVRGRPLVLFSYLIDYLLGGLDTFPYHLSNLIIHIMTVWTLYLLASAVVRERGPDGGNSITPLLAAILFALHPVNTESVTYLSGRSSALSAFWMLLSVTAFIKATGSRFSLPAYALSLLSFVAGLFTKESAAVLPVLLLLVDVFFLGGEFPWVRSRLRYHLPFLVLGGGAVWQSLGLLLQPEAGREWSVHLATEAVVFTEYLRLMLLPIGQNIDHDMRPMTGNGPAVAAALLVLAGFVVLGLGVRKKNRVLSFAVFWTLLSLAPLLVVRLNDFMAERWLYVPSAGFCLGVAACVSMPFARHRRAAAVVLLSVCVMLGSLTIMRNSVYATQVSLWEDAVRKSPGKYRPYANLSRAYHEAGEDEKAIRSSLLAIEKGGKVVEAYLNLAVSYREIGEYRRAEETLRVISGAAAGLYQFHQNLGDLYLSSGRYAEALGAFQRGLAIVPDSALILYSLGETCRAMNEPRKADEYFLRSTAVTPQTAQDFMAQGMSYFRTGDPRSALDRFIRAVKTDPLDVNVRMFLADTYLGNGYADDAFRHYAAAARISPRFARAYRGMGLAMMAKGDRREAAGYFRKALGLVPLGGPGRDELAEQLRNTGG